MWGDELRSSGTLASTQMALHPSQFPISSRQQPPWLVLEDHHEAASFREVPSIWDPPCRCSHRRVPGGCLSCPPGVWNSPSVASPLVDGLRRHHGSAIALSSSGRTTKLQGSIEIGPGQWHGMGDHVTVTSGQSPRSQPVLGHALFFSHIRCLRLVPASGEDIKWILHSRRVKMSWMFLSQCS